MSTPTHLDYIRELPCIICGNPIQTEAAHVRYGDRRVAKDSAGMGRKSDDAFTIPLCGDHHRQQHMTGEKHFWEGYGIDPILVSLALYQASGDLTRGEQIVGYWREQI